MKLEKVTAKASRRYEDACGTAHGLDLLGERWALLVVRELMLGARRFGDLKASLYGVSANVLTQRLEGLEAAGIVRRRRLPPPASVQVYELTEWGLEAEPIILALGRWAIRSPWHDPSLALTPVGLMLSFKAKFGSAPASDDLAVTIAFRLGEETFAVAVQGGALRIERGEPAAPDVTVAGPPPAFAGVIYGKVPLALMEQHGAIAADGDRAAFQRFADRFEMPPKAPEPEPA
jgi:DNA-binding HxlR family transcriptional regulator